MMENNYEEPAKWLAGVTQKAKVAELKTRRQRLRPEAQLTNIPTPTTSDRVSDVMVDPADEHTSRN